MTQSVDPITVHDDAPARDGQVFAVLSTDSSGPLGSQEQIIVFDTADHVAVEGLDSPFEHTADDLEVVRSALSGTGPTPAEMAAMSKEERTAVENILQRDKD